MEMEQKQEQENVYTILEKELKTLQKASEMCENDPGLFQHLPMLAASMAIIAKYLT